MAHDVQGFGAEGETGKAGDVAAASAVSRRLSRPKAPPPVLKPTEKGATALKTIAEVAVELGVATHVLRFWESKFPVLQPLKQRGGRRFYRPADVALLRYIQKLLYKEGYTIRGVQTALKQMKPQDIKAMAESMTLPDMIRELKDIRTLLGQSPSQIRVDA